MNTNDLIRYYGNVMKAAAALGVSYQSMRNWTAKGIPLVRQESIELKTKGKLKADKS